jgi:AraC-like DNA-binding protein
MLENDPGDLSAASPATRGHFRMLRSALSGIQAMQASTRHSFARHTHDQFGIGLIAHGAQKSQSSRGVVEAACGDVITCNPGEVHDGSPIGHASRAWIMLYVDPAVVADAIGDISEGKWAVACELPRPVIRDARMAAGVRELFASVIAADDSPATLGAEEQFLVLMAALHQAPGSRRAMGPVPAALARARQCIDDDPAAPVTLAGLAAQCGLSRFQVVRSFARATGFTPHAYLLQRRVHLARRLIARGMPLSDAAAASGFADQSHMTRLFVRNYGVSPGRYALAIR